MSKNTSKKGFFSGGKISQVGGFLGSTLLMMIGKELMTEVGVSEKNQEAVFTSISVAGLWYLLAAQPAGMLALPFAIPGAVVGEKIGKRISPHSNSSFHGSVIGGTLTASAGVMALGEKVLLGFEKSALIRGASLVARHPVFIVGMLGITGVWALNVGVNTSKGQLLDS